MTNIQIRALIPALLAFIVCIVFASIISTSSLRRENEALKKQIREDSLVPDGYYSVLVNKIIPVCQLVSQMETGQDFIPRP
jgi:sensor domain CHASE-containing protein